MPSIDYVVISHGHYDHLSRKSIQHFIGSDTQFVVPLGLSSYLTGWGLSHDNITEFDWWEEKNAGDITFACTPSQHFSGRLGPKGNQTLWASWVIQGQNKRVYFSGDSGYDIHFKEIGKRYGPFDIAFMEDGQYNKIWYMSHLFPNETIQAHEDVQAKKCNPSILACSSWQFTIGMNQYMKYFEWQRNEILMSCYPKLVKLYTLMSLCLSTNGMKCHN